MSKCEHCSIGSDSFLRCTGCKLFIYCSQACAKADWKTRHKHLCGLHKILSLDAVSGPTFASLPPYCRLEIMTTHLVHAVNAEEIQPGSGMFMSPLAKSITFSLPPALVMDLPSLAVRWYNMIAKAAGARDSEAYLDLLWRKFETMIQVTKSGELDICEVGPNDVRVAVLFVRWRLIWKAVLHTAHESKNLVYMLRILKQCNYSHFLVPASLFAAPNNSSIPYQIHPRLSWLIVGPMSPWLSERDSCRSLYATVYYEMAQELILIAMEMSLPDSWSSLVERRLSFQEHLAHAPENDDREIHDAGFGLDEVEQLEYSQRMMRERHFDPLLMAYSPSVLISNFCFFAFTALLNAVAVNSHAESMNLVNEVLFRRGFFPYAPTLKVTFHEIARAAALSPIFCIIVRRFLSDIVLHGYTHSNNELKAGDELHVLPLPSQVELKFLEELGACEKFYRSKIVDSPEFNPNTTDDVDVGTSYHSCRWCSLEFDTLLLSRFLTCLLFVIRLSNLPLFAVILSSISPELESFIRWSSRLSNLAMQKGRMKLSQMSKEMKRGESWTFDIDGGVSIQQPAKLSPDETNIGVSKEADLARSTFSLAFCHLLIISPRIQHTVLDTSNKQTLYFTCLRAALLTRLDYWTLSELSFLLANLAATDGDIFPDHSCLMTTNYRLAKQSALVKCFFTDHNRTDEDNGIQSEALLNIFSSLPSWVGCPQRYKATVLRFDQALIEKLNSVVFPMPQIAFDDGKRDALSGSSANFSEIQTVPTAGFSESDSPSSVLVLPVSSLSPIAQVLSKLYLVIQWARLTASHPESGGDITEVLIPLLIDLLHRDSCPHQHDVKDVTEFMKRYDEEGTSGDAVESGFNPVSLSDFRSIRRISLTANICTLDYSHYDADAKALICNIDQCTHIILHLIYGNSACGSTTSLDDKEVCKKKSFNVASAMADLCFFDSNRVLHDDGLNSFPILPMEHLMKSAAIATRGVTSRFGPSTAQLALYPSLPQIKPLGVPTASYSDNVTASFYSPSNSAYSLPVSISSVSFLPAFFSRLCSGHEYNLDSFTIGDSIKSTTEYGLKQSLAFAPLALLSPSPLSLEFLRHLGWTLLFDVRYRPLGLVVQPVLGIRLLLLNALLAPCAWTAYLVADLIQQHLINPSPEVIATLQQDVDLLCSVRNLNDVHIVADINSPTLFTTTKVTHGDKDLLKPKSTTLYSSVCERVQYMITSIYSELCHVQQIVWSDDASKPESLALTPSTLILPLFPSYTESTCFQYLPLSSALLSYADHVAASQSRLELSLDRWHLIRELRERVKEDVEDIKATMEARERGLELILSDDESDEEDIIESEIMSEYDEDISIIDPTLNMDVEIITVCNDETSRKKKKKKKQSNVDSLLAMEPVFTEQEAKLKELKQQGREAGNMEELVMKQGELLIEREVTQKLKTEIERLCNEIETLKEELSHEKRLLDDQLANVITTDKAAEALTKLQNVKKSLAQAKLLQDVEIEEARTETKKQLDIIKRERTEINQMQQRFDSKLDSQRNALRAQHDAARKQQSQNTTLMSSLMKQQETCLKQMEVIKNQLSELHVKEVHIAEAEQKKSEQNLKKNENSLADLVRQSDDKMSALERDKKTFLEMKTTWAQEKLEWNHEHEKRVTRLNERASNLAAIESQNRGRFIQNASDSEFLRQEAVSLLNSCQEIEREREILNHETRLVEEWIRNSNGRTSVSSLFV